MEYLPSLSITKISNSLRFRHPCKDCGHAHAAFGKGANLRKVLNDRAEGREINKDDLGEWTCGLEGCVNK